MLSFPPSRYGATFLLALLLGRFHEEDLVLPGRVV
jgi:hypothetical protein